MPTDPEQQFGSGFVLGGRPDDNISVAPGGKSPVAQGQGTQNDGMDDDAQSLHNAGITPGGANVTGGVIRRKRRAIKGVAARRYGDPVPKNYRTSEAVMFNNLSEVFLDSISPEYAQEILEELFESWGLPVHEPECAKYAEDLVLAFLIGATASNKADYYKEYEVPTRGGAVVVNFSVLSDILSSGHAVTRRRFARGMADRMRAYIRQEDNTFMLPLLATRIGCDPQFAYLAFDGSTHCSGMTSRELQFTRTLESRNLFEDDALLAAGASDRLMQGPQGGPRSVVPR